MWPQTLPPGPKPSKQSLDVLIMRYTKHRFFSKNFSKIIRGADFISQGIFFKWQQEEAKSVQILIGDFCVCAESISLFFLQPQTLKQHLGAALSYLVIHCDEPEGYMKSKSRS